MSPPPPPFVRKYIQSVFKYRYAIMLFWFVCLVCGVLFGFRLLANTTLTFEAPSHSMAAEAQAKLNNLFPGSSSQTKVIVMIDAPKGQPVLGPAVEAFTLKLNQSLGIVPCLGHADYEGGKKCPIGREGFQV